MTLSGCQNSPGKDIPAKPSSLTERVEQYKNRFSRWLWQNDTCDEKTPIRFLRILCRIFFITLSESDKDRITLRASSLTFTIVLSLVPTLALGTAVLKGLGAGDQMRQAAYRMIDQMEQSGSVFSFQTEDDQSAQPQKDAQDSPQIIDEEGDTSLTGHLKRAVDTIFDYVEKTDFATLGVFGVAGLVIAVLSVLGNIEKSMNAIWQAKSGRPLGRKLIDYLALMILLPLSVNLTLATEATIQSPTLFAKIQTIIPISWLQHFLLNLLPIVVVVATFTIMYRFLPNTRVRFFPAFWGGIVGGLGWFLLQAVYISLQLGVARYNAIYGSFATLPLFLFWIYMGWLVFLVGAETAFACQVWRHYLSAGQKMTPIKRLTMAFEIIYVILLSFQHRSLINRGQLAAYLNYSATQINDVIEDLELAGLIRHVTEEEGYVPSAPADELHATEIVSLILGEDNNKHLHPLAVEALEAAKAAVFNKKITSYDLTHLKAHANGPVQTNLFNKLSSQQHVAGRESHTPH